MRANWPYTGFGPEHHQEDIPMDQRTLSGFKKRLEARLYELLNGQPGLASYLADGERANDPKDSADMASAQ